MQPNQFFNTEQVPQQQAMLDFAQQAASAVIDPEFLASCYREERPWGAFTNLHEQQGFKVKLIEVKPGAALSLQYHHKRAEHWLVLDGHALVQIENEELNTQAQEYRFIPQGAQHRLTNQGDSVLQLLEVQAGEYLGEDDIVRLEDNYGRNS